MNDPLERFSPATRAWFASAFPEPTAAQSGAWEAIATGDHALVVAPTGSGKTLAAFLWALDRIAAQPPPSDPLARCRVLYVSPLKALAVDVERNLRAPLVGMGHAAARLDLPMPDITVAMRTGDTPAPERRTFARHPSDILITTPESLFLLLTSAARDALRGVETVIVDEVHAVCGTKRGAHLAISLERLDERLPRPAQRIGLSATVRPVEEVAAFLGGASAAKVSVVAPPADKRIDVEVVVPVEDLAELGTETDEPVGSAAGAMRRSSIWPAVEERVYELIQAHRSTIVFANSRRLAERLTARINELAQERRSGESAPDYVPAALMGQSGSGGGVDAVVARAHHGSMSREQRTLVEEDLKAGRLPAVVATSSLELGIDMGEVDLVVQVEAPPSVASGLQRVGRAGHQVGVASRGVMFPKYRGDLVQCTVVAERMRIGAIESLSMPRNPLDVLAQQIVSMVAMDPWTVADIGAVVRRAAPFGALPESALRGVLDMLAGRYPSDAFAELRPRVVWDRIADTLTARPGAQRLAATSGGTIPDRGLFGVFLAGGSDTGGPGRRVGELDEEMVYESRVGDVFLLGSSSWRIQDITHDRVLVTPAPGLPGRMPFWKGDAQGRPLELGRELGRFVRELGALEPTAARDRARAAGLDEWGTDNLLAYLDEQRRATGHVPDDRTLLVERCRDELGDWRIIVHSPFGGQVNAPWALLVAARLRQRLGTDVQAMHADDGIVLRLPDTTGDPPPAIETVVFDPDEVDAGVTAEIGGSALFAARFRECAARALLLPRRDPGRRTALWQQRQRAAQLLDVASDYASFPIVLEAVRECLQDVYDVPGLISLMRDVRARRVRLVEVETPTGSPFAQSLLFGYIGQFLYDGDAPLAERRAQALSLDTGLLAELLGRAELRDVLDADALAEIEAELQRLTPDRRARDAEGVADLLRLVGDLTPAEVEARGGTLPWLEELRATRRALLVRIAGEERWVAVEDAGRLRDALGTALPVGVPVAFTEPVDDPLGDLLARYARTHGPFTTTDVAGRLGLGVAVVRAALHRMAESGRLLSGEFRPDGSGQEWCDVEVLRMLRRRSLARLRAEVEPVPVATLARFLPAWQGVRGPAAARAARGPEGVLAAVEQLAGAIVPASALESLVLPARVAGYTTSWLDELTAAGEVTWAGAGSWGEVDGWVALAPAETADLLLPPVSTYSESPLSRAVLDALEEGSGWFFRSLSDRVGAVVGEAVDDEALVATLWELVWAGLVTNDTLAPLRTRLSGRRARAPAHRRGPSPGRLRYARPERPRLPSRTGPPSVAGRWSAVPSRTGDTTRRAHAVAEVLLERHGVLTRGAVVAEQVAGGFGGLYPVLAAFEDSGRARRGYFVERLGAAQFATPGAVDRLRTYTAARREGTTAVVLAATDPANPFGAALPWPDRPGHRPGRKAGALVGLYDGELVLYVERGGRTLLSFVDDPEALGATARALADAVRDGALGRLQVERADGDSVHEAGPLAEALEAAGFRPTPRGLRLRG